MSKEIKPLTALRGLAAFWVAADHGLGVSMIGMAHADSPSLLPGVFGVDIFFILSGFVITHVHGSEFATRWRWGDYRKFLVKRFARIYPAYFFALMIFVCLVAADAMNPGIVRHPENYPLSTLPAQLLLVQAWGIVDGRGWITPSWSVSAEVFVYLLFPVLAVMLRKRLAAPGILLLVMACAGYITAPFNSLSGYPALIRVLAEFGIGMLLRQCMASRWIRFLGRDAVFVVTILIAGAFLLLALPHGAPSALFFIPAAMIVGGLATNRGYVAAALSHPALLYLGRISYSLYLMHALALLVTRRAVAGGPPLIFDAVFGLLALVFGAAAYHLVERPARTAILGHGAGPTRRPIGGPI